MLYERTALSKKPDELIRLELGALRQEDQMSPDLVFQNPKSCVKVLQQSLVATLKQKRIRLTYYLRKCIMVASAIHFLYDRYDSKIFRDPWKRASFCNQLNLQICSFYTLLVDQNR
jgi:hypothetical protein